MKIDQTIKTKNKLLSLNLVKTKIYKSSNFFNPIKIKNIQLKLKKALTIIYKYHVNNKQIAFIGTSLKLSKQLEHLLFKQTRHFILPESLWVNGSINNQNKRFKTLLKLKKTPDLIVLLNKTPNNSILKESYKTKIITIFLNTNCAKSQPSYKINGNFKFVQNKIFNNFFYSILLAIFKKATQKIKNVFY